MRDSVINEIITKNGLKPGDAMLNISDEAIKDSVIVDNYTVLYRDGDRYTMVSESPLGDREVTRSFSAEAIAIIKAIQF